MLKNKLTTFFILSFALALPVRADFAFSDGADFTGDAFFEPSTPNVIKSDSIKPITSNKTMPPIKIIRLKIKNKLDERALKKIEFAPTAKEPSIYNSDSETSEYASKETEDNFEEMSPDGFEADNEAIAEKSKKGLFSGKSKKNNEDKEDIILDCDSVDYDTPNYLIKAIGNVNIDFVKQGATVKADTLTFDRINNTIKAEGDVKIIKNGQIVTGDYIFVDLNEENALIENPLTRTESIEIRAKKGYVYGDRIVQEQGHININESYPINFSSSKRGLPMDEMITPKNETLTHDFEKGLIKMRADSIKIKRKGDLEVIAIKKGKITKGKHTILKIPAIKIYTNKNHDYVETNFYEVGFYRGLGLYTGPGWVFELPKGSVLKAIPFLNYKSGIGVGGMGRFSSGTNQTTVAYGTAASKFFVLGKQKLDDNLFLQYGMNSYMDEWFLGRRRPKYGVSLVYKNSYSANGFLLPGKDSSFSHRIEGGFFHDLDFDSKHERIYSSGNMSTSRFRYMAELKQNFLNYRNEEKEIIASFDIAAHLSAAIYGTGDTQTLARIGPQLRLQYKRWLQDIGYSINAYDDHSPMARFDAFRYGSQYLYINECLRICRWLTVSWFATINTTNDTISGKTMPENAFYISVGPDDFKFNLGYDFERQAMRTIFQVMMDAKGANIDYNSFEIKQEKKAKKEVRPVENKYSARTAPTQPTVLNKAVVEDIKVMDDVL